MAEWSFEAQMQAAQAIADQWGGWMRTTGADEVVAEFEAVGPRAAVSSQVLHSSQGYNLVSDFNYDRVPDLDPPYTAQDIAQELQAFPRTPDATPDWMRINS